MKLQEAWCRDSIHSNLKKENRGRISFTAVWPRPQS